MSLEPLPLLKRKNDKKRDFSKDYKSERFLEKYIEKKMTKKEFVIPELNARKEKNKDFGEGVEIYKKNHKIGILRENTKIAERSIPVRNIYNPLPFSGISNLRAPTAKLRLSNMTGILNNPKPRVRPLSILDQKLKPKSHQPRHRRRSLITSLEQIESRIDPLEEVKFFRQNGMHTRCKFFDKNFAFHRKIGAILKRKPDNTRRDVVRVPRKAEITFDRTKIKLSL